MDFNLKKTTPAHIVILLLVLSLAASCGNKETRETGTGMDFPESFTFFNLKANTTLNNATLEALEKAFGAHAVTRKTPLDLDIHSRGMLAKALGELDAVNQAVNGVSNERVEHDTTLLTYRYPPVENKFFKYIKIWFYNGNGKPLMVEILTQAGSRYLIDAIREKYGPSRNVPLASDRESLEYWVRSGDHLVASRTENQYGADIYHIKIYFTNNLKTLGAKEPAAEPSPKKVREVPGKASPF